MKTYKAVLFDLDGTLLNTLDDLADSTNYALRKMGYKERSVDEVRRFVGNGVANLILRAVPVGTSETDVSRTLTIFKEHYAKNMTNKTGPYDGIPEVLAELRKRGVPMGIVSNKFDAAVKGLCSQFFGAYIGTAIGESAAVAKKPAPDTCIEAMKEMQLLPVDTVYVGDSDVDILTANNSGLDCLSVTWGFRDEDFLLTHGASQILHQPEELLPFFA